MNYIIELKELGKAYENNSCFSNVSFGAKEGEIVSIVGHSGVGKTTLLKVIANLVPEYTGTVLFKGEIMSKPNRKIFYIPQTFEQLLPWKTAIGNLTFVIKNSEKTTNSHAKEKAMDMLKKMKMDHAADKYPQQLSGGMKQRVVFARALAMNAQVLLLDEPFSAIDYVMKHEMYQILQNIVSEYKTTILFVTHSIEEAVAISSRIVVLSGKQFDIIDNCKEDKAKTIKNIIEKME